MLNIFYIKTLPNIKKKFFKTLADLNFFLNVVEIQLHKQRTQLYNMPKKLKSTCKNEMKK